MCQWPHWTGSIGHNGKSKRQGKTPQTPRLKIGNHRVSNSLKNHQYFFIKYHFYTLQLLQVRPIAINLNSFYAKKSRISLELVVVVVVMMLMMKTLMTMWLVCPEHRRMRSKKAITGCKTSNSRSKEVKRKTIRTQLSRTQRQSIVMAIQCMYAVLTNFRQRLLS